MKSRECLNINDFYRLYINDLDFFIQQVKLRLCPAVNSERKKTLLNEKPPLWLKLQNTLPLEQSVAG